jgi:hypothetical protein
MGFRKVSPLASMNTRLLIYSEQTYSGKVFHGRQQAIMVHHKLFLIEEYYHVNTVKIGK